MGHDRPLDKYCQFKAKQLWGSADELKRTVKFIEDVSLNV
jgi:hypothetical protein